VLDTGLLHIQRNDGPNWSIGLLWDTKGHWYGWYNRGW